ncbi:hypothetical protein E1301_Tti019753 [Triplophysa tibetana]|uniref:Uncharacterized protein n=1 Tax=Triplophysa tibetana TaxID=1572043 RepID=A0A5A9PKS4_9TELE|nr:hypothetical protein E1301_Tti019753 [Triplophysa tibetana]
MAFLGFLENITQNFQRLQEHCLELPGPTHKYHLPSSTVGQAQLRRKRKMPSAPTVLSPTAVKPPTPRQLFPAPPPGAQMVMLMPMPVASQGPVLVPASQAPSVSLSSAPSAPAASAGPV